MSSHPKDLLASLWVLLVAGALVSCERSETLPLQAKAPSLPVGAGESNEALVILTWDEYFAPEVVAGFQEETGTLVEFVTFENLDEMDALLRSRPGDFDLLVASGGVVADLIELKMLQPVRHAEIQGFEHLDDRFLGLDFDRHNTYSVPYMWGTTLIAYRSDKIDEPPHSWKSLWNPSYRDHVLMVDDGFDVYAAALLADGRDLNSQNLAELDAATARLLESADLIKSRFVDIFTVRDELLSGDCWISMTYSSDAGVLAEENENIAYFIPEEGAPLWLDSFVIPRESPSSEKAHQFLSYLCRPEVAAANSNALWSASANAAAKEFLSEEILEDPTLYLSPEVMERCKFDGQSSPERQQRVNQGLKRVFDRVRENRSGPELSVLTWENYLSLDLISRFEKESGSQVKITELENSEQFRQEFSARMGTYDVAICDEMTLERLRELRLLAELDHSRLGIDSLVVEPSAVSPFDPESRFSVPYLWGLTVLAGNKEKLAKLEPTWNLLWRDDLRINLIDEPEDLIWIALLSEGRNPSQASEQEIDHAIGRITGHYKNLKEEMADVTSALDALEAGEKDLVIAYNGDALTRALENPEIAILVPREGAPIWIDSMAISRDAPNEELAHRFINFMSRPENSAASANALAYASPIAAAKALMDPALLATPVLYPDAETLGRCAFVKFPPEQQKHVNQALPKMMRGASTSDAAPDLPQPGFAEAFHPED